MAASATSPAGGRHAAFTLLEVLVTIGLIALLTGVLVVGAGRLLGDRPRTADELFWAAVAEARSQALLGNRDVRLGFDPKANEFTLLAGGEETRLPFVPKETNEFDFLAPKSTSGSSAILVGGQLVETRTTAFVTFYRDGTCSPFRAQIRSRAGARILEVDPWTCAPMLYERPAP